MTLQTRSSPLLIDVHNPRAARILDVVGDGTGAINGAIDGSITPVYFKVLPPTKGAVLLTSLTVMIQDSGAFSTEKYGNINGGLPNGVAVGKFAIADDSLVEDYTLGFPVRTNIGWTRFTPLVDIKTWSTGDEFLIAQWLLGSGGTLTSLVEGDSTYFGVKIQDDCTGLTGHAFSVEGHVASFAI